MKKLPLALALVISFGVTLGSYAATPQTDSKASLTTTVVALGDNKSPTASSVNSGKTYILVGTAATIPPGTKITCCVDQLKKVRVPLKNFSDLKAYDLTKDGYIDLNEAGYQGLFLGRLLPNGNLVTTTLKAAGITAIHYNKDGSSAIAEYSEKKIVPLVIVTVPG